LWRAWTISQGQLRRGTGLTRVGIKGVSGFLSNRDRVKGRNAVGSIFVLGREDLLCLVCPATLVNVNQTISFTGVWE